MIKAFVNAIIRPPDFEAIEQMVIEQIDGPQLDYAPDDLRLDMEELIDVLKDPGDEMLDISHSMSDLLSNEISQMLVQDFDSSIIREEIDVSSSIYSYVSLLFPHVRYAEQGTMLYSRDVAAAILPEIGIHQEDEDTCILVTPW